MTLSRNNKEVELNKSIKQEVNKISFEDTLEYKDWVEEGKPKLQDWSRLVF